MSAPPPSENGPRPDDESHDGTYEGGWAAVVDLARLAPSVHNTQPWHWRAVRAGWELHVDVTRSLPVVDVSGRERLISCGAALHHAGVAAAALGLRCEVDRWPDPARPELLALLRPGPGTGVVDPPTIDDLRRRRTDRRRFTDRPLDAGVVADLCAATPGLGAQTVPVTGLVERLLVEQMVGRARLLQSHDPRAVLEHRRWSTADGDGISPALVPPVAPLPLHRRPRFEAGALADDLTAATLRSSDSLLVLATRDDHPASWLAAGEALSALWLRAVRLGISVLPLSQVTEVRHTRAVLRSRILAGCLVPQLLLRVGWHEPGHPPLPERRLRPRADVVDPLPPPQPEDLRP